MSIVEKAVEKYVGDVPNAIGKLGAEGLVANGKANALGPLLRKGAEPFNPTMPHAGSDNISGANQRGETLQHIDLDLKFLADQGLMTPESRTGGQFAEEVQLIKRRLLAHVVGRDPGNYNDSNLIMITSSAPDEGKTFLATNLALSIAAEIDKRVLLVDADVKRSDICNLLGIEAELGWTDLLIREDVTFPEVLIRTNIDGLTILPAGTNISDITERVASQKMRRLARELASRYSDRIIIFDSAPLLATSEAVVLASLMGQVVVVVESEKTTHQTLAQALDRLENLDNIGLVLNKTHQKADINYYDYYKNL